MILTRASDWSQDQEHEAYKAFRGMNRTGSPRFTFGLFESGRARAVSGIVSPWPGVGEIWMLADQSLLRNRGFEWARNAKRVLKRIESSGEFRRLQTCVYVGDEAGARFVEFLGFREECRMKKYGPNGEDCAIFAKLL